MNVEEYDASRPRFNRCSPTVFEVGDRPTDDELAPWLAWFHRHGIDANDVAIPGRIERHEDEQRISYVTFTLDDDERPALDPATGEIARVVRTVQLSAAPEPFPPFAR